MCYPLGLVGTCSCQLFASSIFTSWRLTADSLCEFVHLHFCAESRHYCLFLFLQWPPHCSHISSQCPPITALSKLISLMLDNGVPGGMTCFVRMIAEVIKILALTQNKITSLAQLKGMRLEFIHFPADTPGVCMCAACAGWLACCLVFAHQVSSRDWFCRHLRSCKCQLEARAQKLWYMPLRNARVKSTLRQSTWSKS